MNRRTTQPGLRSNRYQFGSLYFGIQSFFGLLWWVGIWNSPVFARYFFSAATVESDMKTFVIADSCWFVAMSGLVAIAICRNMQITYPLVWCLVGAVGYALLCCLGMMFNGGPRLSVALMLGSFCGTLFFAKAISRSRNDDDGLEGD